MALDPEAVVTVSGRSAAPLFPDFLEREVAEVLGDVASAVIEGFGADLRAIVLFGSAAEGRMRLTSDVNLLVVLERVNPLAAEKVRPGLQLAEAAIELHVMVVLANEMQWAAEAFSLKFDDMEHRHFVVWGEDPFTKVTIPRPLLLHRIRQVLLNTALRLRSIYMVGSPREETLAVAVANAAAPLRRAAFAFYELRGQSAGSPKEALEAICREMPGEWTKDLAQLSLARESARLPAGTAEPLLLRLSEMAMAVHKLFDDVAP
ncbi:MAG: nucleotidyltransferase domain-containing protein [Burkholderiaceae bacterium]